MHPKNRIFQEIFLKIASEVMWAPAIFANEGEFFSLKKRRELDSDSIDSVFEVWVIDVYQVSGGEKGFIYESSKVTDEREVDETIESLTRNFPSMIAVEGTQDEID